MIHPLAHPALFKIIDESNRKKREEGDGTGRPCRIKGCKYTRFKWGYCFDHFQERKEKLDYD